MTYVATQKAAHERVKFSTASFMRVSVYVFFPKKGHRVKHDKKRLLSGAREMNPVVL
jgi:hypothetical protein